MPEKPIVNRLPENPPGKSITRKEPAGIFENKAAEEQRVGDAPFDAIEALFRPVYRNLSPDEKALHDDLKAKAARMAQQISRISPTYPGPDTDRERGANVQLAIRAMQIVVFHAIYALTGGSPQAEIKPYHTRTKT